MLVVTREAEVAMLEQLVRLPLVARLFANDRWPGRVERAGGFAEPTAGGYAAQPLDPATWTVESQSGSVARYPTLTWRFTAAVGHVYGYYITRGADDVLWWAERFTGGPFLIENPGDRVSVDLLFELAPRGA